MRSLLVAAGLVAASAWAVVHELPEGEARAETQAVRPRQVQSVSLDGGPRLPLSALRSVLETRAGDQLDQAKLDHDRLAMQDALAGRGYLAAKVGAGQVTFDDAGAAYVTFSVETGPEFHLRSVQVTGAAPKDAGVVTLSAGEVASPARIAEARDALADRLTARGKPASVTVQTTTDASAAAVDVVLSAQR
jgi:outer membrane protein assembly factor BamA